MRPLAKRRFARREDLELNVAEFAILARLSTPQKIQAYLNALPANHEIDGETILSVREVLKQRRAHCIEGAFVAASALWVQGLPPLLMHLDCTLSDYPHVIALYRVGKAWGAISKTNGVPLRHRDPIYRSLRELVMSYFHEYADRRGRRTLRSHSVPLDMRRMDPELWVTSSKNCWAAHDRLLGLRHYTLITKKQEGLLSRRDPFERRAAKVLQYPKPDQKARSA